MKVLGITEEVNTCDCCGRTNLKCTVAFENEEGGIIYYGRVCASRNTGKPSKVLNKEAKDYQKERLAVARRELYNCEEQKMMTEYCNKKYDSFEARMSVIRPIAEALHKKTEEIRQKYNLQMLY